MDDKKNEDYAIKMPDVEMRNFNGRSSPSSRDPFLSKPPGRSGGAAPLSSVTNSPPISILAYCLASISMTVTNKYCVSGANWNLNFFYLAIQVRLKGQRDVKDVN
jgi:GDP-mannose transporter